MPGTGLRIDQEETFKLISTPSPPIRRLAGRPRCTNGSGRAIDHLHEIAVAEEADPGCHYCGAGVDAAYDLDSVARPPT
jgi:hypothetical protein